MLKCFKTWFYCTKILICCLTKQLIHLYCTKTILFSQNSVLSPKFDFAHWSCRLTRTQEPCHVEGILPLDRLCTTLASVLHTSIHLKNLQKTEWHRYGRSRSDAQVSDGTTKTLREKTKNSRNRAKTLSVTQVFSKRKEVF